MRRNLKNSLLLLCMLVPLSGFAQQDHHHRFEAPLGKVPADGFYRIGLGPEIIARAGYSGDDLRVLDGHGRQVPYVTALRDKHVSLAFRLPVVATGFDTERHYFVVAENRDLLTFERLWLRIGNTEASRGLSAAGSNDQKTWYAIREDFAWESFMPGQGSDLQTKAAFSVPATNYRYLRITFVGRSNLPVRVDSITTYGSKTLASDYTALPAPSIQQTDSSDKHSYIRLRFGQPYHVDKLELSISGPKYFHRFATFHTNGAQDAMDWEGTTLSTGTQTVYPGMKGTEISLEIRNDDNQPLHLEGVKAFQEQRGLIAYLEAGKDYTLTFGDATATAPVYDLAYFKDSIGKEITELPVGAIRAVVSGNAPKATARDSRWIMWIVIGLVLAGLLFMTTRMLRQVSREEQ